MLGPSGRTLRLIKAKSGHLMVAVSLGSKQSVRKRGVHQLVCEAFHGMRPSGQHEVAHGDGNPANNSSSNVRWATRKENIADRYKHGTAIVGEAKVLAKLNDAAVRDIRATYHRLFNRGACKELAKKYGVSISVISSIGRGHAWGHVKP